MNISDFNAMTSDEGAAALRPCLDVQRWLDTLVAGRPYTDVDALVREAEQAAEPLTPQEVDQALSHHPRIGERAEGASSEATMSRSEQASLNLGDDVERRLREGNQAYEERFARVFLIRAAGRTSEEILDELQRRLANDDAREYTEVGDQLRQIAVLRLKGLFSS